jgi:mannose-6-phosphate isomerase
VLYPLKFRPRLLEKIWGGRKLETLGKHLPEGKQVGESWELYDFPPGAIGNERWESSIVSNGSLAGQTLHEVILAHGRALYGDVPLLPPHGQFPLLVKFLDAREHLSVQVHPDAAYAAAHPGAHLKTEAWYVVQADPGARLFKGLRPGVTRAEFAQAIRDGTVEETIRAIPAKEGHCHFLPSGTVHALGAGILVAEMQTPSDTTYRVFDFNRVDATTGKPRPLHVDDALACIDFTGRETPQPRSHVAGLFTTVTRLVTSEFFKVEKVRFAEGVEEAFPYDEPVVWMMLDGQAEIKVDGLREPVRFGRGDTVLLPAQMDNPVIKTTQPCVWLEVTFPTKPELG